MTNEMQQLYDSLITIEVKSIVGAYDYIGNKLNSMDMDGTLSFVMDSNALKNIKKDYKLLKKFYKGKIELNTDSVYLKYPEESEEHFFLKCLVRLMNLNSK